MRIKSLQPALAPRERPAPVPQPPLTGGHALPTALAAPLMLDMRRRMRERRANRYPTGRRPREGTRKAEEGQVRLALRGQEQHLTGKKGPTATPTAPVVLVLFAHVTRVHFRVEHTAVLALYGLQAHYEMVCNALEIDCAWDEASSTPQNRPVRATMSITSKPYDAAWAWPLCVWGSRGNTRAMLWHAARPHDSRQKGVQTRSRRAQAYGATDAG